MSIQQKDEIIKHTINYIGLVTDQFYDDKKHWEKMYINKQDIYNLIDEGYNFNDFKKIIDFKWNQWKYTQFRQYVRPITLFGKNFQKYLNEQSTSENKLAKLNNSVQRAKSANWRLDKK